MEEKEITDEETQQNSQNTAVETKHEEAAKLQEDVSLPPCADESEEDQMASFKNANLFDDPQEKPAKSLDATKNIERLLDVEMNVTVRFGKTEIPLRDAVNFGVGSMIELNRLVDEPVDLLVNNYPFARGEVVVIDGYYGVRVTEIGTPEERSNTLLKNAGH